MHKTPIGEDTNFTDRQFVLWGSQQSQKIYPQFVSLLLY